MSLEQEYEDYVPAGTTLSPEQESGTKLAVALVHHIYDNLDISTNAKNYKFRQIKDKITDEMRAIFIQNRKRGMPFDRAVEIVRRQIKRNDTDLISRAVERATKAQESRQKAAIERLSKYKPYVDPNDTGGPDEGWGFTRRRKYKKRTTRKKNKKPSKK